MRKQQRGSPQKQGRSEEKEHHPGAAPHRGRIAGGAHEGDTLRTAS